MPPRILSKRSSSGAQISAGSPANKRAKNDSSQKGRGGNDEEGDDDSGDDDDEDDEDDEDDDSDDDSDEESTEAEDDARRGEEEKKEIGKGKERKRGARGGGDSDERKKEKKPKASKVAPSKLSAEDVDSILNDAVRYCLFMQVSKSPIKYSDISKLVLKQRMKDKGQKEIMKLIDEKIMKTFGYHLIEADKFGDVEELKKSVRDVSKDFTMEAAKKKAKLSNSTGVYLMVSVPTTDLHNAYFQSQRGPIAKSEMGLLMVIFVLIQMNDGIMDGDRLFKALEKMGLRKMKQQGTFNYDAKYMVETKFVKEMYLDKIRNKPEGSMMMSQSVQQADEITYSYAIGQRAKKEVGDEKIYRFMCALMDIDVDETEATQIRIRRYVRYVDETYEMWMKRRRPRSASEGTYDM